PLAGGKYEALHWLLKAMSYGGHGQLIQELAAATGLRAQGTYTEPVRRILVLIAQPAPDRAQRAATGDLPEFALAEASGRSGARVVIAEEEAAPIPLVNRL